MIFDTLNDPQESKDLASSKPELQARMKAAALSNRRASLPSKTVFDSALVPAVDVKGTVSPGLRWALYEGIFPGFRISASSRSRLPRMAWPRLRPSR
ncbi:MAG: hypothetical protein ACLT38_10795 [Akkermansia sp.]